jgi:hypothetical protein
MACFEIGLNANYGVRKTSQGCVIYTQGCVVFSRGAYLYQNR